MRWSVVLVFIVALSRVAYADDEKPKSEREQLSELVFEGDAEEGYHRLVPLVAAHPRDAELHYYLSEAAERTGRYGEARAELDAGLALDPEHVGMLTGSGYLYIETGDFAKARPQLDRALALDPDYEFAHETLAWLQLIENAKARRAGKDPDLEVGSPAWVVDRALERAFAGATTIELITFVSPEIMRELLPPERTRANLLSYAESFGETLRDTATKESQNVDGWVIGEVTRDDDGVHTRVVVDVAMNQTHSADAVDEVIAALTEDEEAETDWPTIRDALLETEPELWPAARNRLVGLREQVTLNVTFEVAERHGVNKISDVIWNDANARSEIVDHVYNSDREDSSGGGSRFQINNEKDAAGFLFLGAFAVGMIVLAVYLIAQRVSARRALARANRRE